MSTLRYKGEFDSSIESNDYDIYIDDDQYVLSTNAFTINNFKIRYLNEGATNTPQTQKILPSEFTMEYIKTIGGDDTLESQMIAADEERFKIRIDRNGSLYWTGFVLTDRIIIEDIDYPAVFNIQATDGLGRLKDIPYNNGGTKYSGRATMLEHIFNCLNKIPLDYFYGATDDFLKVIVNWYEDQHVVTSTLDPLTVTDVDHQAFYSKDSKGNTNYLSCYEVLEEILGRFKARMYQSDGVWIIEQINERENATFTEFVYYTDQTHASTDNAATYDITLSTTAWPARTSGGSWSFYPPIDQVCELYKHNQASNLLTGTSWDENTTGSVTLGNLDIASAGEKLRISGALNYVSQWTNLNNYPVYRHTFYMKIKVGNYYLKRTITDGINFFTYNSDYWTTNESYYQISTPFLWNIATTTQESILTGSIDLTFETPELYAGGDIDFDFYYVKTSGHGGTLLGSAATTTEYNLDYDYINPELRILDDGNASSMATSKKYCVSNDSTGNTSKIDIETIIGDGPGTTTINKLKVYDGTGWEQSEDWRVDDTGTAYTIQELTIRQILAAQKTGIKVYNGSIIGNIYAHSRLNFNSEYYLFEGGEFDADKDQWTGTWFKIALDTTGISTDTPVETEGPGQTEYPGGSDTGYTNNPGGGGGGTTTAVTAQSPGLTTAPIITGFVDVISVPGTNLTQFAAGDTIQLVDPISGATDTVTIAQTPKATATTLLIESYLDNSYPNGAAVIPSPAESVPETQTASEVVADFFTNGTIDKSDYYFKTTALLTKEFNIINRTTSLTVAVTEFVWTVPAWLDGTQVERIYTAFATAGTTGNTTIDHKINGSNFQTATIASGSKTSDNILTTAQALASGDEYTIEVTANATTPAKGLNVSLWVGKQPVYLGKFTYQLNRVITDNLQIWYRANYIPQLPISYGAAIFSSSGYIDCDTNSSTDITGSFSIMCWVKFNDFSSTDVIAGRFQSLTGYHLYTIGSFIVLGVDSQTACSFATTGMDVDKWYHIAATYDGTDAYIYLDGVQKDTATYTAPSTIATNFFIGADDNGAGGANFLTGTLAHLRLWETALTIDQIQSIANKKYTQFTASEKVSLVSAWELDDITATTAADSHGDNEGTIN